MRKKSERNSYLVEVQLNSLRDPLGPPLSDILVKYAREVRNGLPIPNIAVHSSIDIVLARRDNLRGKNMLLSRVISSTAESQSTNGSVHTNSSPNGVLPSEKLVTHRLVELSHYLQSLA
jgi:hypothetical protein